MRVDLERTTLTGRVHRDNLEAFLELFTDAFLKPAFDEDDFERVRSDAINAIENTLRYSSDEELGKAALHDVVFRGTPYAHSERGHGRGLAVDHARRRARVLRRYLHARRTALLGLGGGLRRKRVVAQLAGRRAAIAGRRRRGAAGDRRRRRSKAAPRWSSTSRAPMPRSASASRSTCAAASATSTRCGSRTRGSASTAISRATCST